MRILFTTYSLTVVRAAFIRNIFPKDDLRTRITTLKNIPLNEILITG